MRDRATTVRAVCLVLSVLSVLSAGCTSSPTQGPRIQAGTPRHSDTMITVGSFDFPENVLLARLYAGALAAKGFPVQVSARLGTRELVQPALMNGLIQVVPEYAGSALGFMSLGHLPPTSDPQATHRYLAQAAEDRGLVAGQPAAAENNTAIVVTAAIAGRYHLRSISDLVTAAPDFVFGGPPECPERAYCLLGLQQTYGLQFKAFAPTDAGGPLTRQALISGQIDVGLLFTTDPSITAKHLVILEDDMGLQPAENITPLVSLDTMTRYGPRLLATLDAVSARLTTPVLRSLNARVELAGQDAQNVADGWLRAQGLGRGKVRAP